MAEENKDQENSPQESQASLDQEELTNERAREKVELDLDDAPFLEEEEEDQGTQGEAPPEEPQEPEAAEKEKRPPPPFWKQNIFIIGAAGGLLLAIILVGAYYLLSPEEKAPEPSAPEVSQVPEVETEPEELEQEYLPEKEVDLKPFLVELETEDRIHFLFTQFSLSVLGEETPREIHDKKPMIRDSIYYYLRHQESDFLQNERNTDQISQEIQEVVSQYLRPDQLQNIVIQDFRVQ